MRALGITALLLTALSFVLWFVGWILFTFVIPSAGYNSSLRYAAQGCSVLHILIQFLAIAILSIGLILFAKNLPERK